jgi:hypothetical protein
MYKDRRSAAAQPLAQDIADSVISKIIFSSLKACELNFALIVGGEKCRNY